MKNNLMDALRHAGLREEEAALFIRVTSDWVSENYPIIGAMAVNTIIKDCQLTERSGHRPEIAVDVPAGPRLVQGGLEQFDR